MISATGLKVPTSMGKDAVGYHIHAGKVAGKVKIIQLVMKRELSPAEKKSLGDMGLRVISLKGHSVVETEANNAWKFPVRYDYVRRLLNVEYGRAITSEGEAVVYTATDGGKMRHAYEAKNAHGPGSCVYTQVPLGLWVMRVEVVYSKRTDSACVTIFRETVNEKTLEILREAIWEGGPYDLSEADLELPFGIEKYRKAIKAAIEKAGCFHCKHNHFYF